MSVSVIIACSLDGFSAREDGALDWLPGADGGGSGAEADHGYAAFMARVDAIMGGDNSPADLADRVARAVALREEVLTLVGDTYTPRF